MILIDARDRDWLRIIYEFKERLQHFHLAIVTYGIASAPYQILRISLEILIFLANASINDPIVQAIIKLFEELFFADDFFGEVDDLNFVAKIISKLIYILQNHGIELSK